MTFIAIGAALLTGCGAAGGLSASSSCSDFSGASSDDQVRFVRKQFDPDHKLDQYDFAAYVQTVQQHCSLSPDDKLSDIHL